MNVNILGKGLIPGLRMLAPVRNVDLDQQQIARILKVKTLKVTRTDSPDIITLNNLASAFAPKPVIKTEEKKKTPKVKDKTPADTLLEKAEEAGIEVVKEATDESSSVDENLIPVDSSDVTLAEGLVTEDEVYGDSTVYEATVEETSESDDNEDDEVDTSSTETVTTTEDTVTKSKKNKKNRHNK